MLDAYIIEEIQREEQKRKQRYEEGRRIWQEVYIPLPIPAPEKSEPEEQPYKIEISMI